MKKIIGYGASFLLLAAAGGIFFGASTAEAGHTTCSSTSCPPPTTCPPPVVNCNQCLAIVQDCFDEAQAGQSENISPGQLGQCLLDNLPEGCLALNTTP
ncbi:hypothetical protein WME90_21390 [Sorangium sp. So ce375]|uniref:hypothetical protein n=1 Tax=Sorangium sp. So ce375 TaxID=3133306 RepID=UPI003F5BB043